MKPECKKCDENHILHDRSGPSCTAHRRGTKPLKPCRQRPIPGGFVCRFHGGAIQETKDAAAERLRTREIEKDISAALGHMGIKGVDNPYEEMARLASEAIAFKDALASRVNSLEATIRYTATGAGTEQLRSEVALYERALDRTGRFLDALVKSGFEERRVRIDEQTGAQVAAVLQRILAALHLTPEQQAMVSVVVPGELRSLEA